MAPVQVPGVNLPFVTGPLVLGYMFGFGLFGILIVQMYIYHITFPNDQLLFKALAWSVFTLELAFTTLTVIAAWNGYGKGWGDLDTLTIIDWSWEPLPALNGLIGMMVQLFFCWRIYQLTKFLWLPAFIACVSLMQCVVAFYYGIKDSVDGRTIVELKKLSPFISVWLSGSAACDILITVSMVTILVRASSRSAFERTTSALTKVIKFTIETGLVTSIGALLELILWLSIPQYNFHFIFFLMLGKLYSNCLLATLNSRALIWADRNAVVDVTRSQTRSALWADMTSVTPSSNLSTFQRGAVHITTTKDVRREEDHEMLVVSKNHDKGTFMSKEGNALPADEA